MSNIEEYAKITFDDIKHIDEFENEYWEARELMPLLEYSKWENFHKVIKRAMIACETSNNSINDHFPEFRKTIAMPKGESNIELFEENYLYFRNALVKANYTNYSKGIKEINKYLILFFEKLLLNKNDKLEKGELYI